MNNQENKSKNGKGKKKHKKKKPIVYCDSSDSDLSSDLTSDSESDCQTPRKRGRSMRMFIPPSASTSAHTPFSNPNNQSQTEQQNVESAQTSDSESMSEQRIPENNRNGTKVDYISNDGTFESKARSYQRGKRNMVWADLAEEERIQEAFETMDVVTVTDKFVIERGCESYVVGNKRKRKHPENIRVNLSSEDEGDCSSSYSSVSDGGLSDDSLNDLRKRLEAKRSAKAAAAKTAQKIKNPGYETMDDELFTNAVSQHLYNYTFSCCMA